MDMSDEFTEMSDLELQDFAVIFKNRHLRRKEKRSCPFNHR
jgi:hypothetical protein